MRPRSALIVNAYSYRNAGDAAIMLSTASLLRADGYSSVLLSTRYLEDRLDYERSKVELFEPLVDFPPAGDGSDFQRLARFLIDTVRTVVAIVILGNANRGTTADRLLRRVSPKLAPLLSCDSAVIAGGGYLYSSKRYLNLSLIHSCLTIWICRKLAHECVMMPASVGPIHRRFDRWMIATCLRGVEVVLRERQSMTASSIPIDFQKSTDCPDVAFWGILQEQEYDQERIRQTNHPRIVRLVAMDWAWSSSVMADARGAYISGMAELCDLLADSGWLVELGGHSLIPEHHQNDLDVCREISASSLSFPAIDNDCDVMHLWQRYETVDVVVGTRLHACIMAIAVGTPAIVIGYQEKAEGVARMVDADIDVFRVDEFDAAKVYAAVERASGRSMSRTAARLKARISEVYSVKS